MGSKAVQKQAVQEPTSLSSELNELVELVRIKNRLLDLFRDSEQLLGETVKVKDLVEKAGVRCGELFEEMNALEIERVQMREEGADPAEIRTIVNKINSNQNQIRSYVVEVGTARHDLDTIESHLQPLENKARQLHTVLHENDFIEVPHVIVGGQTRGGKLYQLWERAEISQSSIKKTVIQAQFECERILKNFREESQDLEPLKNQLSVLEQQRDELENRLNNFSTADEKQLVRDLTDQIDRLRTLIESKD